MLTAIGMSLLKIYLWGAGIIIGLFLLGGGLIFVFVKATGKKPEKNGGAKGSSMFMELLRLLRMAAFFGFLWPYIIASLICHVLKQWVPIYAKDIKKHNEKKNNAP